MIKLSTITHAKWILSGEHSVLRGYPALVFPLANYSLKLDYQSAPKTSIQAPMEMKNLLQKLWEQTNNPPGKLTLKSTIPVGSGLGASAALCLAIAQISAKLQQRTPEQTFSLAKELEDHFHGQSSGLDIVGSGSTQGHYFSKTENYPLNLNWRPHWALSFSNEQGNTKEAINKVKHLIDKNPQKAQQLDQQMAKSVEIILKALQNPNSINELAHGMNLALNCFKEWGLITPKMQQVIDKLFNMGAKAVKPTGSGGGGYLLSLWDAPCPDPQSLIINLPNDKKFHLV